MQNRTFKAFISYSHADEAWGKWVHRRLETYAIPKRLIGQETPRGQIPRRLTPIFRDQDELAAANDLGSKIEAALKASENLIVICSPNAAKSAWVEKEILYFKQNCPERPIYCVIASGEPFADAEGANDAEECFPKALRYQLDQNGRIGTKPAEPLAADLRPHKDGKRYGLLKLISGLLGVGLDTIVQRDMIRVRRRVTAITLAAGAAVLVMGSLTMMALSARKDAKQRQADAEGQIEFMLTDLKDKLKPVGRLDALKLVGERAEAYYAKQALSKLDEDALGRRARVFHYLGEIDDIQGDILGASARFSQSYNTTKELLSRDPDNPDRIFEHAQSAFWVGYMPHRSGDNATALPYMQEYNALADRLIAIDPENEEWQMESHYGNAAIGAMTTDENPEFALPYHMKSKRVIEKIAARRPDDAYIQLDLVNQYNWISAVHLLISDLKTARLYHDKAMMLVSDLRTTHPLNVNAQVIHMQMQAPEWTFLFYEGKLDRLVPDSLKNIEMALSLSQADPDNHDLIINLATAYKNHAWASMKTGDMKAAESSANMALSVLRQHVAGRPFNRIEYTRITQPIAFLNLEISLRTGKLDEALLQAENINIRDTAKAGAWSLENISHPEKRDMSLEFALLHGRVLAARGDFDAAASVWRNGLDAVTPSSGAATPETYIFLYQIHTLLGNDSLAAAQKTALVSRGFSPRIFDF